MTLPLAGAILYVDLRITRNRRDRDGELQDTKGDGRVEVVDQFEFRRRLVTALEELDDRISTIEDRLLLAEDIKYLCSECKTGKVILLESEATGDEELWETYICLRCGHKEQDVID